MSDILALRKLPIAELKKQYRAFFPDDPFPGNRKYTERKVAYQLQEAESGGLPDQVKRKIDEMIRLYDPVNQRTFKTRAGNLPTTNGRDPRLPMPGYLITKTYKDQKIEVAVLENGFSYQSKTYKNLSAVAEAVTGNHWNGFLFFGLNYGKKYRS